MKCPYCNQDHPDDFQFCPKTGKRIENQNKACTNEQCSAYGKYVLPQDAKFCPNCGCAIVNDATDEEHNVEKKDKFVLPEVQREFENFLRSQESLTDKILRLFGG